MVRKTSKKKSRKDMAKSPCLVILILAACLQNAAVLKIMLIRKLILQKQSVMIQRNWRPYPQSSILGVGCGNPTKFAHIKEGDTVVDLGSGAGIDVFLAANIVKENGKVIGIDMTDKMLEKARQ